MLLISKFTVRQLLLAAGESKKIRRSNLVIDLGISQSYITKLDKDEDFRKLVDMFRVLPLDEEMKEYKGISTLYKIIAKFLYTVGDKE